MCDERRNSFWGIFGGALGNTTSSRSQQRAETLPCWLEPINCQRYSNLVPERKSRSQSRVS